MVYDSLSSSAKSSLSLRTSIIRYSIPRYTESSVLTSSMQSCFSAGDIPRRCTSESDKELKENEFSDRQYYANPT